MSLFDLILSGAKVTNLDGTEANVEALDTDGAEVGTTDETEAEETTTVDENVETTEDSSGDEVIETDELDTELLEVEEEVDELEQREEAVEEGIDAALDTEAFLANLFAAKALGGLSAVHGELATEHVRMIGKRLGFPDEMVPAIDYGVESYSTVGGVALNTEGAIEATKNFFIKILDAILQGIAWIVDKGKQVISKLFNNFDKMLAYVEQVRKKLEAAADTSKEKTYKSAGHAIALTINGKLASPQECIVAVQEVANEISKQWKVDAVAKAGVEIGDVVLKTIEEIERNSEDAAKLTDTTGKFDAVTKANDLLEVTLNKKRQDIVAAIPYVDSTKASTDDLKRCGIKLQENEQAFISKHMPRNKVCVTIVGDVTKHTASQSQPRFFSKIVSYKVAEKGGEINIPIQNKSSLFATLTGVENLLRTMKQVKRLIEASQSTVSKLNGIITKLKVKSLAITKKARDGRSVMENFRGCREAIVVVKNIINVLREPGTSFSTYVLFEAKSLLDVLNKQASFLKPEKT